MNQEEKIIELFKIGNTILSIKKELKIPYSKIIEILEKNDLKKPKKFFSDEQKKEIVNLYKKGKTITEIGKKIGFSTTSVGSFLEKENLRIRKKKDEISKNSFEKYEKNKKELIRKYKNGESILKISKEYKLKSCYLKKYLNDWGIKTKTQKKYFYDETFFEKIDTEEKAYWLGFLYADGCVQENKKRKRCILELAEKDKEHLILFAKKIRKNFDEKTLYSRIRIDTLGYDKHLPIEKRRTYKSCAFYIQSKKIAEDLIKLGCVPDKSLILTFPTEEQVPEELIRHFVRGFFDGDGSVTNLNSNKSFTFIGTLKFLEKIQLELFNIGIGKTKIMKNKNIFRFSKSIRKKDTITKIYNYFYKDSNIYLKRKYDIFSNLMPSEAENK